MNPFLALGFGVLVGVFVQAVATRLRYDEEWSSITLGKRWAMVAVGGVAALAAGLLSLDHPRPEPATPFVYRMWLWQIMAAWSGGIFMDVLGGQFAKWLGSQKGPPHA